MKRIIFVCYGNICRSPMAEIVMKDRVEKLGVSHLFEIKSAAANTRDGNPVYAPARRVIEAHGLSVGNKRSYLLRKRDYDRFDMIICMDRENIESVKRITAGDPENKITLLLDYAGRRGEEVADPWFYGNFDQTWTDVNRGVDGLIEYLLNEG